LVSKTRVPGLFGGDNRVILRLLVLTQNQRVTDGRTDTPSIPVLRCNIFESDKNGNRSTLYICLETTNSVANLQFCQICLLLQIQ